MSDLEQPLRSHNGDSEPAGDDTAQRRHRAQQRMNAYWSARADVYDEHQQRPQRRDLDHAAWTEVFATVLPAPGDATGLEVLDVGTGSGYLAFLLSDLGHRVTGIDLAEGMLERAARRLAERRGQRGDAAPAPVFAVGDAVRPPFPAGSFDAVVNRYVVWTLRDPRAAVVAWRRLLRPGGVLVVVDGAWFPQGLHEGATPQFRHWYDASVREHLPLAEGDAGGDLPHLLRAAGFTDVVTRPLTRFLALDHEHGVVPGHAPTLQHLTTALRPHD